jgi:hypothetical protein
LFLELIFQTLFNINQVSYDSGVHVDQGKELTPTQVKNEPTKVNWLAEEGSNYTLCMTGNKDKDIFFPPIFLCHLHFFVSGTDDAWRIYCYSTF